MKLPNNYGLPRQLFDITDAERNSAPPELVAALAPVGKRKDDGKNDQI